MMKDHKASATCMEQITVHDAVRDVLTLEAQALLHASKHLLAADVTAAVTFLETARGRVIFAGMGKSGIIAQKIAATFSSLGTQACFLHPSEALHGDLGVVASNDVVVILSKSAGGDELERFARVLRERGVPMMLISCRSGFLTPHMQHTVTLVLTQEACHLGVAPTSSSTLMLAFGDALAVTLARLRGFTRKDFSALHPGGMLGTSLSLTVKKLAKPINELALITKTTPFKEVLLAITNGRLGHAVVVDSKHIVCGVITDGDLRRACLHDGDLFMRCAEDIMTKEPKTVREDADVLEALNTMEAHNITALVVISVAGNVVGLIHIHDIIKAGVSS